MSHMRIIGGELRGRRLLSPPETAITRPMPARVRESLFGLFRGHTQDAMIFDTFSGTGSFGLEAISRGAAKAVFVEKDKAMAKVLRQNAENLGVLDKIEIFEGDALGAGALSRCPRPVTLVLLDPPYPMVQEPLGWQRVKLQAEKLIQCLSDDGFLVLRVPHPFFFGPNQEEAPDPQPKRKKGGKRWSMRELEREEREKKLKKKPAEPEPIDLGDGDETSDYVELDLDSLTDEEIDKLDALDEAQAAIASAAANTSPPPAETTGEPVSVKLIGAKGPETHIYGTMAVHLYMKA